MPQNSSVAVFTDPQSLYAALLGKSTGLVLLRFKIKDSEDISQYNGFQDIAIS